MNDNKEKNKDGFANAWKKASEFGKKTVESAKSFAEQTKKNIHDQQAKKYTPVTAKEFKDKGFKIPSVIEIVDNSANRDFIEDDEAIGWIEEHKEVEVLHMYADFVKKCGLMFVPLPQQENVYCFDIFDSKKYINVNQVFSKATEEKLAELRNIAYCLGAKSCSIEIMESDTESDSRSLGIPKTASIESNSQKRNMQSGKTVTHFEGHDEPKTPDLKWFKHDDNIKGLIEMRLARAIKSNSLNLSGETTLVMSKKVACAIDQMLGIKGDLCMEKKTNKEHSKVLVYEVEF